MFVEEGIASIAGFLNGAREQIDSNSKSTVSSGDRRQYSSRNTSRRLLTILLDCDNYGSLHFFTGRRPECLPLHYSFQLIVLGWPERLQKECGKKC
jgi:hypothetical protein